MPNVTKSVTNENMLKTQFTDARTEFCRFLASARKNNWTILYKVAPKTADEFRTIGFFVSAANASFTRLEQREWMYHDC